MHEIHIKTGIKTGFFIVSIDQKHNAVISVLECFLERLMVP